MVQLSRIRFIRRCCAAPRNKPHAFQRMARFDRSNWDSGRSESSSTSGSLKPPRCRGDEGSAARDEATTLRRDAESPRARRDGDVELFCQFTFRWEFFSGTQCPQGLKTPAAARSHRRVFGWRIFAVGHDFCLGLFARVNWSYQFHVCDAKVTKYSPSVHTGFD